ncbi:MAG: hypothetical protein HYX27_06780 [Acidobacteria bacterium]|nr:hypothetical protein [Acidobacteriota bacterium]
MTIALGAAAFAAPAETAGSVSASKGLQLNGQPVPVAGTKSWPVSAGDDLRSDATPAVLTLKDGSKIVLGKNSQAKVEEGTVRLVSGTMQYAMSQGSKVQVAVKGDVLSARTGLASTVTNPVAPVITVVKAEDLTPVSRRQP